MCLEATTNTGAGAESELDAQICGLAPQLYAMGSNADCSIQTGVCSGGKAPVLTDVCKWPKESICQEGPIQARQSVAGELDKV